MAPQQRASTSVQEQNAPKGLFVDTRPTTSPPNAHGGLNYQPPSTMFPPDTRGDVKVQPPTSDPDFDAINEQLLGVAKAIEATRAKILRKRAATEQERAVRLQCSSAYKHLYAQYRKIIQELHDTSSNGVSLQGHLEEARRTISAYESTIEDYEQRFRRGAKSAQMAEHDAARIEQLEYTVMKLEEEKTSIAKNLDNAQEYRVGLAIATDRLCAAEQKIAELEKEKESIVQANAADRLGAQRKIDELEQKCSSADHAQASTTGKRQAPGEVPGNDGPAKRVRRRRAMVPSGGDSITVLA